MKDILEQEVIFNHITKLDPPQFTEDKYFGTLLRADEFVEPKFKPDPQHTFTNQVVNLMLEDLGLTPPRPSDQEKYVFCLSDFLRVASRTKSAYISWPTGDDKFPSGSAYTKTVAKAVRETLIAHGYLRQVQAHYQKARLARVYLVNLDKIDTGLKFIRHGIGPVVSVRAPKEKTYGEQPKGKDLPKSRFMPEIECLEVQVRKINAINKKHPLTDSFGDEFFHCRRIFNNSSVQEGGRLYGPWQVLRAYERLALTIDQQPVCEIDLKACYLQICNALIGPGTYLGTDPYQKISYVKDAPSAEENRKRRELIKRLVAAYLCKQGSEVGRFPQGETVEGRTISIREEFGLDQKTTHRLLMASVFEAYPFLQNKKALGVNLSFKESEIMIAAILNMVEQGLPAFPMHDCLIVRQKDSEVAVKFIQDSMLQQLGMIFEMDVTSMVDGTISEPYFPPIDAKYKSRSVEASPVQNIEDLDDYDVLEDW